VFLHVCNKLSEDSIFKNQFIKASKRIKYLEIDNKGDSRCTHWKLQNTVERKPL
jgi:hypothetical protein